MLILLQLKISTNIYFLLFLLLQTSVYIVLPILQYQKKSKWGRVYRKQTSLRCLTKKKQKPACPRSEPMTSIQLNW